jgi:hypothetical protein
MELIGKLEEVQLREVWAHEALGFSRWLEENLELLGATIGRSLTILERERKVGSFNVDLVAEDESGNLVIIENQLEPSNHDHLGKVLTYLTNLEAKIAVWIVKDGRAEHVRAVQWLNEVTPRDVAFYLVKLAAYRISNSPAAPLLTTIVGPSEDSKDFGDEKKDLAERHRLRLTFWEQLLERAKAMRVTSHSARSPSKDGWISAGAGKSGLHYNYVIRMDDEAKVELYIDVGDPLENKRIFDTLAGRREVIERAYGGPLEWDRLDERRASRIICTLKVAGLRSAPERWGESQTAMIEAMDRLVKALGPEIKALG